jgi:hypothetical protein
VGGEEEEKATKAKEGLVMVGPITPTLEEGIGGKKRLVVLVAGCHLKQVISLIETEAEEEEEEETMAGELPLKAPLNLAMLLMLAMAGHHLHKQVISLEAGSRPRAGEQRPKPLPKLLPVTSLLMTDGISLRTVHGRRLAGRHC